MAQTLNFKKHHTPFLENEKKWSILIPSWNNLAYLQLCINSLRKNSAFRHQIIVVVNEGADGTLAWVQEQPDLDYVHAAENVGICIGLNACRSLIATNFVVYANDDMYFLPAWDSQLQAAIDYQPDPNFMLSATMIEPCGDNPCCQIADFGSDISHFQEEALLQKCETLRRSDWSGSTWPPNLMPLELWDIVGGMSIEFSPGMYSDPDLSHKLWTVGVRRFIGVGSSLVYHFGSKSTKRIKKNRGRNMFIRKWGKSANFFMHNELRIGKTPIEALKSAPMSRIEKWKQKIKLLSAVWQK